MFPLCVVVLNWTLPQATVNSLISIRAALPPGGEIIIVDTCSTADSLSSLREQLGSQVTLVESAANLGFAAGINAGIRRALADGARAVLLLNNDTRAEPGMIEQLLSAAAQHPRAGILGPVIYCGERPRQLWHYAGREYAWLPVPWQVSKAALQRAGDTPFQVDYVTACAMLIRREVFETIGLLDERYYLFFEDSDYCRRTRAAGFEIWCVPQARLWHAGFISARKDRLRDAYAQAWGRAQFYRQYPHGKLLWLSRLVPFLKLLQYSLMGAWSGRWWVFRPLWAGTLDGFRSRPARLADFPIEATGD